MIVAFALLGLAKAQVELTTQENDAAFQRVQSVMPRPYRCPRLLRLNASPGRGSEQKIKLSPEEDIPGSPVFFGRETLGVLPALRCTAQTQAGDATNVVVFDQTFAHAPVRACVGIL
jgi:hypothetical protein